MQAKPTAGSSSDADADVVEGDELAVPGTHWVRSCCDLVAARISILTHNRTNLAYPMSFVDKTRRSRSISIYVAAVSLLLSAAVSFVDAGAAPATLSVGTFSGQPGASLDVPITIGGAVGQDILAYKIVLSFNPIVLRYKAVSVKGAVTEAWGRPVVNPQEDRVTLVAGGVNPIAADGKLLSVTFEILPDATIGAKSALSFSQARLNEGTPEVTTSNGSVAVAEGEGTPVGAVRLSAGAVSARAGDTASLPLSISGLSGNTVSSFRITLAYPQAMMSAKGVSLEGTVVSSWTPPQLLTKEGEITVTGNGPAPASEDGVFLKIQFDIRPEAIAGEKGIVSFKEAVVNGGGLQVLTTNGSVSVAATPSGPLTVSMGQAAGNPGDSVSVAVTARGARGRDILAFRMSVRLDSRIAAVASVSSAGTLTEGWSEPAFRSEHDTLSIAAAGVSPISDDGDLLRLVLVISKEAIAGGRSSLSFLSTSFESLSEPGEFSATAQDGEVSVDGAPSAVEDEGMLYPVEPGGYLLEPNYPNPFNPRTTIHYALPEPVAVRLAIYDTTGRLVRLLQDDERRPAGQYRVAWDGRGNDGREVASGVYYCRMSSDGFSATKIMTLAR